MKVQRKRTIKSESITDGFIVSQRITSIKSEENNVVRRSRPPISAASSRRDIKLCVVPVAADRLTLQLSRDYGSGHDIVEKKYDGKPMNEIFKAIEDLTAELTS